MVIMLLSFFASFLPLGYDLIRDTLFFKVGFGSKFPTKRIPYPYKAVVHYVRDPTESSATDRHYNRQHLIKSVSLIKSYPSR